MKNLIEEMISIDNRFYLYKPYSIYDTDDLYDIDFQRKRRLKYFYGYDIDPLVVNDVNALYIPTKSRIFIPDIGFRRAAAHQLAHILERNNSKITEVDYGFKVHNETNQERGIVSIFEASSKNYFIALARESRVCAIELVINGEEFHPSFLKHGRLTNRGWEDIGMKHLNYSKFKTINEVGEWSAHIMLKTYQNWNQDKVMHVWKEKADYIRNWMES